MHSNRVVLTLVVLALASLLLVDFASIQANRIVPGHGLGLFAALGTIWALAVLGALLAIATLALRPTPSRYRLMLALVIALLLQLPPSLAWLMHQYIPVDQPYARAGLASGGWSLLFLTLLLLIEVRQRLTSAWWRLGPLGLVLVTAYLLHTDALEPLALLREYASRRPAFWQALRGHLALVGGALGVSLLLGLLLTALLSRLPRLQRPVFGLLNLFQTIPSLALFGLLLAPLSYLAAHSALLQQLNVRGIGWAPALLALILYSLLPMLRNTWVALQAVTAEVIDAARGMGMGPWQVFSQVRLPLALPVILEGMRITTVQAIGLTAVAALIGAEGFGTFIFQGLGQGAMDLVLLGALPTIVLALLADALFNGLVRHFQPGARP